MLLCVYFWWLQTLLKGDPSYGAHSFCLLQTVVEGDPQNGGGYVKLAFKLSAGGPAIGLGFALCLTAWLRWAGGNFLADLGTTVVAAYGSFHVADILGCSDILATVALGMCMAIYGCSVFKEKLKPSIADCW